MNNTTDNTIKNATITAITWNKERGLTQYIALEGDGWGCSFGGYYLGGDACYDWIMQIMDVLELWEFCDKTLIGRNVRVRFSDHGRPGSTIEAIGHIIEDKWFCPKEFFDTKRNENEVIT